MKKLTILGVGALLCLLRPKAKRQKLRAKLTLLLFCCTLPSPIWAQKNAQPLTEVQALRVGDQLSAGFWKLKVKTLDGAGHLMEVGLDAYQGKALLIDFWACWCGSCIIKFPRIDSLQTKFASQLKILPVNSKTTKDTHDRIQALLAGQTEAKFKLGIPSIVDDELITQLFPHYGVPHYVWINQAGVVKAITMSFMVKEENIQQMLAEDQ